MTRPKVVLYNPQAVHFTMPLALVAIASALDRRRFRVSIVDARLETDAIARLVAEARDALCVGMSVLTGAPISDALRATRALRAACPHVPIVWGGWHASLFPDRTLVEADLDAVVIGQGELTFAEIVERLAGAGRGEEGPAGPGATLDGVAGCHARSAGGIVRNPPRALVDLNALPAHDYALLDVARYFELKRHRQLDYISSQGCRFRCTFCADPFVYGRGWSGLEPERIASEALDLKRRYGFSDIGFQDETFFTSGPRVASVASAFLERDLGATWIATMRADQGARLDDAAFDACRRSGLRRVIVGIESGSQPMLDWMKKDIRLDQVFETAEKCRRHGIGILFNLIVGFPGEPDAAVDDSLRLATTLCRMSARFEAAIFYFKPYPGNPIADDLRRRGHRLPAALDEWAAFDYVGSSGEWVAPQTRAKVERVKFYLRVASARATPWRRPLQAVARWRRDRDFFSFPVEKTFVEWLRPPAALP